MEQTITLVPVGQVTPELLRWLKEQLAEHLGLEVQTGEQIRLPEDAFNPTRGQYLGPAILDTLAREKYADTDRVVGLVDADCYAQGLNFIFGQATLGGMFAFVALPRLRESFYGKPEDPDLFQVRVLKEVVHELGHTWGLDHCPNPNCVMHFSDTLGDTDSKSIDFCPECAAQL